MKNKYNNKLKLRTSIVEILLGAAFCIGVFSGLIKDDYWTSFGIVIAAVGIANLIRCFHYENNEDYREKIDIAATDERNRYLSTKAWAWAGYWYVLGGAISTIVFKLMGREDLMTFASFSVCILMVLYWLNYLYLKKKY